MEKCDLHLVEKLLKPVTPTLVDGFPIEIKPVPDEKRGGVFDPREYFFRKPMYDFQKQFKPVMTLQSIREHTRTACMDLTTAAVGEQNFSVSAQGRTVPVSAYCLPHEKQGRQAVIYIHGGSFFAGQAASYKHVCTFLAQRLDAVVFNVEYSLAPEHKFPAAILDCCAVTEHIFRHAADYGIDCRRIALCGDSAGGNLVVETALALRDTVPVCYLGLFYPCVDLFSREGLYNWSEEQYELCPEQRELQISRLALGRADGKGETGLMEMLIAAYLPSADDDSCRQPGVSPVYADLSGLPHCTVFTAEYDGLRLQDEYFARCLRRDGVSCRLLRYRGVSHAFLDYLGVLPQAQAALEEMARELEQEE